MREENSGLSPSEKSTGFFSVLLLSLTGGLAGRDLGRGQAMRSEQKVRKEDFIENRTRGLVWHLEMSLLPPYLLLKLTRGIACMETGGRRGGEGGRSTRPPHSESWKEGSSRPLLILSTSKMYAFFLIFVVIHAY